MPRYSPADQQPGGRFGTAGGPGGQVGNTAYAQVSPMNDPTFAALFGQTQEAIPTQLPGIGDIISQGMNSPLLQQILGPMLQRLQAPQAQQRQQLTESTRAAGGLRSSQYTGGMNDLMQNQGLAQNDLMSQVLSQVLGQVIQGSLQSQQNQMLPGRSLTDLLRTIAPSVVQDRGGGSSASSSVSGRTSMMSPNDVGNYAPGNAITQPGVGAPLTPFNPQPQQGQQAFVNPQGALQPPPQYVDPWIGGGGGQGGGWFDIGGGTNYMPGPADPGYGGGGQIEYGPWLPYVGAEQEY